MRRKPGIYRTWREAARRLGPVFLAGLALLLALLAASTPAQGQAPIVEVKLPGVGSVVVQGAGTMKEPRLPVAAVEELTGEDLPERLEFVTVAQLKDLLGVPVIYRPRQALVLIDDQFQQLAASQARMDGRRAQARVTAGEVTSRTGPWAAVAGNSETERSVEFGWSFEDVSVSAVHSSRTGNSARVSVNPVSEVWVSARVDERLQPSYSARLALGRSFVTASFSHSSRDLSARAVTRAGPFHVSIRGRDLLEPDLEQVTPSVAFRGDGFGVAVARTDDRYVGRVVVGARAFSPLSVPRVR